MNRQTLTTTLLIVTFLVSMVLFSGCKDRDDEEPHAFMLNHVEDILDLTPEQTEKLKQYQEELRLAAAPLKEGKKQMYLLAKNQLSQNEIDTAAVKTELNKHQAQLDQVMDLAIDKFAAFFKELTPEQRQKLLKKFEKIEKRHMNKW